MNTTLDRSLSIPEALQSPDAYVHPVDRVGFLETHISYLFFVGDRVFKVKKPVRFSFLDYGTLERRRFFCDEEVRLNRRLAPGVYLGVRPVTRDEHGRVRMGGSGTAIDAAVEMKMLPAGGMLKAMLIAGEVDEKRIDELARFVVASHELAPVTDASRDFGRPVSLIENVERILEDLPETLLGSESAPTSLSPEILSFLRCRTLEYLERSRALLLRRAESGKVRELHGDLHADNICFVDDRIVAYDCIEFSERLRCADVFAEIAFVAMEIDHWGSRDLSERFVDRCLMLSRDTDWGRLIDYYKCYYSMVRGKVLAIKSRDRGFPSEQRAEAAVESMRYLQRAASYLLPPFGILLCGLPGVGKSRLAKSLAEQLGATWIRSDVVRKKLEGIPLTRHGLEDFETGLYDSSMTERTYGGLLARTRQSLSARRSVVLDATFGTRKNRSPFLSFGRATGYPLMVVHVTCPEDEVRRRMIVRGGDREEVSDANWEIYRKVRDRFEPPSEVGEGRGVVFRWGVDCPDRLSTTVLEKMLPSGSDASG